MVPLALEVYARDRETMFDLLVNPAIVSSALLGVALFAWRKQVRNQPLATVLIVAAIGVLISYFVQGKWFAYHAYPSVALLMIAFAIVVRSEFSTAETIIAATVGTTVSAALSMSIDVHASSWLLRQVEFHLFIAIFALCSAILPSLNLGRKPISMVGISCAFAAIAPSWSIFHAEWTPEPLFVNEIKALGGNPKVGIIGPYGALGLPVTDAVRGRWAMSFIAMMLTDAANRDLRANYLSGEERARLDKYKIVEYDGFIVHKKTNPPYVLIVDKTWAETNFHNDELRFMVKGYNKIASRLINNYYASNQLLELFVRDAVTDAAKQN
jgi:hypothetical protein